MTQNRFRPHPKLAKARFAVFCVVVTEILAFIVAANLLGVWWTLLLLFSTGFVGLWFLRREGFRAWASLRRHVYDQRQNVTSTSASDSDNSAKVADVGVRMLAGVLLTLPGFVTDVLALVLLLIPRVRHLVGGKLAIAALRTFPRKKSGRRSGANDSDPEVIEGEVIDPEEPGR